MTKNKIKLFDAFTGYGGASWGLKKANIPFEVVGYSEIDKFAIKLYELNHKRVRNFGDITKIKIKELPDFDFFTGGFPCQTFSSIGHGKGELDPRGTLFWRLVRVSPYRAVKEEKDIKYEYIFEKYILEFPHLYVIPFHFV